MLCVALFTWGQGQFVAGICDPSLLQPLGQASVHGLQAGRQDGMHNGSICCACTAMAGAQGAGLKGLGCWHHVAAAVIMYCDAE